MVHRSDRIEVRIGALGKLRQESRYWRYEFLRVFRAVHVGPIVSRIRQLKHVLKRPDEGKVTIGVAVDDSFRRSRLIRQDAEDAVAMSFIAEVVPRNGDVR